MFFVVLLLFPKKNQQHVRICLFYQDELINCLIFCVFPQDLIAWYCVLTCCCLCVYQDELVNVRTFLVVFWSNSLPRWVGKLFVCLFFSSLPKLSGKMSGLSYLAFFYQTKLVRCSYVFTFVLITKISFQFVRIFRCPEHLLQLKHWYRGFPWKCLRMTSLDCARTAGETYKHTYVRCLGILWHVQLNYCRWCWYVLVSCLPRYA